MINEHTNWAEWLEYRALNNSDSIFENQSDWTMNSCLNYSSDMTGAYTQGFKAMAKLGIKKIQSKGSQQDVLVYPIVFCFRHHIELQLKQAISYGFEFLERKQRIPNIHEIDKLWFELRGILKDVKMETEQHPDLLEMKNAERVILELAGLDPEGVSFRYSKTRDGSDSICRDLRMLDLQSFSEAIEKLSFFLDCVKNHLYYFVNYKHEAESEVRHLYE